MSFKIAAQAPPVSTLPQNKNAVLEIYDGIYCTYCPQGHQIAADILENDPGDVVLISIHSGQYSVPAPEDPDLRTEFGAALAGQTGLTGYPAGTVNRHVFPGLEQNTPGTTAINRVKWQDAVDQILEQPAPVNIAAAATVDITTGILTINVEFFYTASSYTPANYLHVALLQDHISGPQIGGAAGNLYDHRYVLRHLLTGQWGQAINNTASGYFEGRQYSYLLPDNIRNIPLDKSNLKLAIFISEGHQEILNGIAITPAFLMPHAVNAGVLNAHSEPVVCNNVVSPSLRIRNEGNNVLNSLQLGYQVNGGPVQQFTWYGSLNTYEWADLTLPAIYFEPVSGGNLIRIFGSSPNGAVDEWVANDTTQIAFQNAPVSNTTTLKIELKTDAYGYETYWELLDDQEVVYDYGGNENVGANGGGLQYASPSDPGAYGNHQYISKYITVPADGCYYLRILDDYGDGMCCGYGNGYYRIKNATGNLLVAGGLFTAEYREPVKVQELLVAAFEAAKSDMTALVYPNPLSGGKLFCQITLREAQQVTASIHDALGRPTGRQIIQPLPAGETTLQFDTAGLPAGMYHLRLSTGSGDLGKVFVIQP